MLFRFLTKFWITFLLRFVSCGQYPHAWTTSPRKRLKSSPGYLTGLRITSLGSEERTPRISLLSRCRNLPQDNNKVYRSVSTLTTEQLYSYSAARKLKAHNLPDVITWTKYHLGPLCQLRPFNIYSQIYLCGIGIQ